MFYVVTGDIQPEAVVAQIRAAYASAKARSLPAVVLPAEPRQTAAREIIEEAKIELGHLHFAWHIPEVRHHDIPLLDVLSVLLGNGRSSRLFQQVREIKGVAHQVDAWTYNPGLTGLFGISAVIDGEQFTPTSEAILIEVERVKTTVTAEEVAKAVKQFVSATLSTRKTMEGQAQNLGGNWMAAGDLNFSERYLAAVKNVTPAEIQRVAREYLTAENRTLYALLPEGFAPKAAALQETNTDRAIEKFVLPNGLTLLLKEDHRLPFVEFRSIFQGGVLAETTANNGITQLLSRLLIKGTARRTAESLATEIESVGGSIDSYGGNQSFGVNVEVMSGDFAVGLDLLADVLLNPTFPADALEREREVQIAGIHALKDELLKSASLAMRKEIFGEATYGLDPLGTEAVVQAITPDDVRAFHRQLARPNNCVLAIYGDINIAEVRAAVDHYFAAWEPSAGRSVYPTQNVALKGFKRVRETRDKKQAVLVVGFPGATMSSDDRFALELIQESCSDLGSRLFLRIREELGLAYYVGAQNFAGVVPGYFAFYTGTEPDKAEQVEQELLREAMLLRNEGLTADELKRAKAKIIGQKKISRQDLGHLASATALDELYGLGYGRAELDDAKYEAVTLEQIKRVAQKYLKADALVVALVAPEK